MSDEFEIEIPLEPSGLRALAMDSTDDPVAKIIAHRRHQELYPQLRNDRELTVLQGAEVQQQHVANEAVHPDVVYLTGSGHGEVDHFTGYQGQAVFQVGQYNPEEVAGKIVHLLACRCAQELGPDLVENGCRAFFGYVGDFTFKESAANIFAECDGAIDLAISSGVTAAVAFQRADELFREWVDTLRITGRPYTAAMLELDRRQLRAPSTHDKYGDPYATLT